MVKALTTQEIRDAYVAFFKDKGHVHYPSASLIPENDPTILFTVAGMAQFKDMFLGRGSHDFTRAVTCQKVIRTNDIMEVGRTPRHHTFFEMLGNFSFNDYFKREAITWAWEFLTGVLELPPERLSVSVHEIDDEAYRIWNEEVGIPAERLFRLGDADNFWPANAPSEGPFGPGGCCSEIFWDFQNNDDPEDNLTTGSDRFVEVWNLVFPQYNVCEPKVDGRYTLEELGRVNIDTGMGLERIACVLQGKTNNFDTDEFQRIIKVISEISGVTYVEGATDERQRAQNTLLRRVADHVRAVSFCVHDGAIPSNVGRGYVVRRLIRRACLDIDKLGVHETALFKTVAAVCEVMGVAYPELHQRRELIEQTLQAEEDSFRKTLRKGLDMLHKCLERHKQQGYAQFSGDDAFELVTTHGFPRELIEELLEQEGLSIDEARFDQRWNEFVQISRSKSADVFTSTALQEAKPRLGATPFIGYDQLSADVEITLLEVDGREVSEAASGTQVRFALNKTPFYAESGGQLADHGTLRGNGFVIQVEDVQKDEALFVHAGTVTEGTAAPGTAVAEVNVERRLASQANHSATHLLHSALGAVLGDHITQQGSQVGPDGLRFDYNNPQAPEKADLQRIEDWVNRQIASAHAVQTEVMPIAQAKELGAKAQFGEKYGADVRIVTMGSADVSLEFCGGCHVRNTADIKQFRILKDEASSAGIRRITAVSGDAAVSLMEQERALAAACAPLLDMQDIDSTELSELGQLLKLQIDELPQRLQSLREEAQILAQETGTPLQLEGKTALERCQSLQRAMKQLRKQQEQAAGQKARQAIDSIIKSKKEVAGQNLYVWSFEGVDARALKQVADAMRERLESYCIVLGSNNGGKAMLVTAVSPDLNKNGITAGDLVAELARKVGGGGGGRPDIAQAGGKQGDAVPQALNDVESLLADKLRDAGVAG